MMKVAINHTWGAFALSNAAIENILTRKLVSFDRHLNEYGYVEYYAAGHAAEDDHFIDEYDYYKDRSDPDLIAVVEQMGSAVNKSYSNIVIVDIPDGISWHIGEYDGWEHVAESHRTWRGPEVTQDPLDLL